MRGRRQSYDDSPSQTFKGEDEPKDGTDDEKEFGERWGEHLGIVSVC